MLLLMFLTIQENVSPKLIFFSEKVLHVSGEEPGKKTDFVYKKPNNFFTPRTFLSYSLIFITDSGWDLETR